MGVSDDFEDPNWAYIPQDPKSTEDIDENQRGPMGRSTNGRWYEGIKRGHPDIVRRVPTPAGGLPGSTGSIADEIKVHRHTWAAKSNDASRRLCGERAVSTAPTR